MASISDAFSRGSRAGTLLSDVTAFASQAASATRAGTGTAKPKPQKVDQKQIDSLNKAIVKAFVSSLGFRVEIPGTHKGGISNQLLGEVLGGQGRDFTTDSIQLHQWLRKELADRYQGFSKIVTIDDLREFAAKLIVNFMATRVIRGGEDISLTPLTAKYAAYKRAKGKGSKPIGVFSGEWLRALRAAKVIYGNG